MKATATLTKRRRLHIRLTPLLVRLGIATVRNLEPGRTWLPHGQHFFRPPPHSFPWLNGRGRSEEALRCLTRTLCPKYGVQTSPSGGAKVFASLIRGDVSQLRLPLCLNILRPTALIHHLARGDAADANHLEGRGSDTAASRRPVIQFRHPGRRPMPICLVARGSRRKTERGRFCGVS